MDSSRRQSTALILRKLIELEQQGAEQFFGELSFEMQDRLGVVDGFGAISILRLSDMQNRPKLFSSFMRSGGETTGRRSLSAACRSRRAASNILGEIFSSPIARRVPEASRSTFTGTLTRSLLGAMGVRGRR